MNKETADRVAGLTGGAQATLSVRRNLRPATPLWLAKQGEPHGTKSSRHALFYARPGTPSTAFVVSED